MNITEIRELLESNKLERIKLENIKTYNQLTEFLTDNNAFVRRNARDLLFSKDYVPTKRIIQSYNADPNPLLEEIIVEELDSFIPILFEYLIKDSSFSSLYNLLGKLTPTKIFGLISPWGTFSLPWLKDASINKNSDIEIIRFIMTSFCPSEGNKFFNVSY